MVAMDLLDDESLIDLRRRASSKAASPQAGLPAIPSPSPLSGTAAAPAVPDGMCGLCVTRPARGTCAMCGRGACAADLWVMLRLCRSCASERDMERSQRPAQPEASNWLGPRPGGRA